MKTVQLIGGLGNWMFQIAFLEYLNYHNIDAYIHAELERSHHSSMNYFETIFNKWNAKLVFNQNPMIITEDAYHERDLVNECKVLDGHRVLIVGYFQDYKYITNQFLSKIVIPTHTLEKYSNIGNTVFLHIRGGDYINTTGFDLKLDNKYYPNAIKQFPEGTHFSVFTNDIDYAKSRTFLNDISYSFVNENELDSLFLMSQCSGGICANSTFSWWGAYLNRNRKLTWPSKFMNAPHCAEGYRFPELIVLDV
jgi:Glycosyl transferase family 11